MTRLAHGAPSTAGRPRAHYWSYAPRFRRERPQGHVTRCFDCGATRWWSKSAERWIYRWPSGSEMKHAPTCEPHAAATGDRRDDSAARAAGGETRCVTRKRSGP